MELVKKLEEQRNRIGELASLLASCEGQLLHLTYENEALAAMNGALKERLQEFRDKNIPAPTLHVFPPIGDVD